MTSKAYDCAIFENPPWLKSKRKYKMGLNPTSLDGWITPHPKTGILDHKKQLLVKKYNTVTALTKHSLMGQKAFAEFTGLDSISTYPDSIANVASQIAEDVCLSLIHI